MAVGPSMTANTLPSCRSLSEPVELSVGAVGLSGLSGLSQLSWMSGLSRSVHHFVPTVNVHHGCLHTSYFVPHKDSYMGIVVFRNTVVRSRGSNP